MCLYCSYVCACAYCIYVYVSVCHRFESVTQDRDILSAALQQELWLQMLDCAQTLHTTVSTSPLSELVSVLVSAVCVCVVVVLLGHE